ncbi:efflux RND transporter periplasmic adaptor subunit [Nitrospira moscoviensis]|uniref:efflux RND transporter periplasmic adaptor subunit n=1 Tax=Nitrospira moscoviensis TaxID=42253 RepID=UPI003B75BF7A
MGYTTIHSPVNGIVVSRNVDVGQTIAAQFQTPILFVIAQDLTQMQVNANVSESDIGGVTEGTEASFRVDAYPKQFFTGRVTQVRNAPVSIQNVVEAVIMTAIGGALGVAAGIGAARVLTAMIGWPTIINTQAVAAAFVFSLIVGVFFGLYPANKASKLNPIEALHYE